MGCDNHYKGVFYHLRTWRVSKLAGEQTGEALEQDTLKLQRDTNSRQELEALQKAVQECELRGREVAALLKGARAVLRTQGFEEAARSVFDYCRELIGATSGYVALLSETGEENEVLFLDAGGLPCTVDPKLPMPIRGLREVVYRSFRAAYENDFLHSKWKKYLPKGHVMLQNVLFAPLLIDGMAVGVLGLANKSGGFTENDANIASGFGELAAIALRNSQSLDKRDQAENERKALIYALQKSQDMLEKRVEERTTELISANEQLRAEIEERKRAEDALRESEEGLRFLSSRLITAQESERKRISIGLHDQLGQDLMVLKLQLRSIQNKLMGSQAALKKDCEQSRQYIDKIAKNVRRLSKDLSPSILEDLGLPAALKWLIDEVTKHDHIRCTIDMEDIHHLFSAGNKIIIFRIFQEALTNVVKHAQASRLSVVIKRNKGSVLCLIEDDGTGFDVKEALGRDATERGLGLPAMDERARMLGGVVDIWSQKGAGTKITLTIPVTEEGSEVRG